MARNNRSIGSVLNNHIKNPEEVKPEDSEKIVIGENQNEENINQGNEGSDNMATETVTPTIEEKEISPIRKTVINRQKRQKLDETHTRATFLVKNELLDKLNWVCGDTRGLKTELINQALELALATYDEEYNQYLEEEKANVKS